MARTWACTTRRISAASALPMSFHPVMRKAAARATRKTRIWPNRVTARTRASAGLQAPSRGAQHQLDEAPGDAPHELIPQDREAFGGLHLFAHDEARPRGRFRAQKDPQEGISHPQDLLQGSRWTERFRLRRVSHCRLKSLGDLPRDASCGGKI